MPHQSDETRPEPKLRSEFRFFAMLHTRWRDNDRYGHLNNAVYYELFDSAINELLIKNRILEPVSGNHVFLVVSSGCDYFSELSYPNPVEVGLAISRLGKTSVSYDLGLFKMGEHRTAANGFFVHVHVARSNSTPVPIKGADREALAHLVI